MNRLGPPVLATMLMSACAGGVLTAGSRPAVPPVAGGGQEAASPPSTRLLDLIQRITAADYAGDRAALDRLYVECDRFLGDQATDSRVLYWKGFAKWRRAINGANEQATPPDLATDVDLAATALRRAAELDPAFVDARIGEMQCLGLVLFFDRSRPGNEARGSRLRTLLAELKQEAVDNPRFVWAWGMAFFGLPPEHGGGPANVIAAYLRALDRLRTNPQAATATPFDPSWGEAELLVNLAYSYLHKPAPDLVAARRYVDEAIRLVPTWHYARDVLRPQIEAAQASAETEGGRGSLPAGRPSITPAGP